MICPNCGSSNINGPEWVRTHNGEATGPHRCVDCGRTWEDRIDPPSRHIVGDPLAAAAVREAEGNAP